MYPWSGLLHHQELRERKIKKRIEQWRQKSIEQKKKKRSDEL